MFGFSFSELVVVAIVALVVMGPKDLPTMLRRLGQWAGKIRRAAADLRAQSGIDDALRSEGLADDIAEIRKLARGELDAVQRAARVESDSAAAEAKLQEHFGRTDDFYVVRDREYPRDGADAYEALPDNAIVYAETLPRSKWARDPLYVAGDADAVLPPEPEPEAGAMDTDEPDASPGAVGPTLIGGIGLTVPYESPGERSPEPVAITDAAPLPVAAAEPPPALPTLIGAPPVSVSAEKPDDTDTKDPADDPKSAEETAANTEARN